MRIYIFLLFIVVASVSCKKAIEKKAQDMLVDAITNGYWIVEQYVEAQADITTDFTGYDFKFNENGTVIGIYSGTNTNGTWIGSVSDYTITSDFPTANNPLKKLNGVWKLVDSDWDYVKAEMTIGAEKNILKLRKKK